MFRLRTLLFISCAWFGGFQTFAGLDDLEDINFPLNSSVVVDGFQGLDLLAAVMAKHSNLDLEIIGHTDSLGTSEYNKGLSVRRAKAVREYLVSKTVGEGQVKTLGEGVDRTYDNGSREGRFQNRRVSLILYETLNGARGKVTYERLLRLFFGDTPEMVTWGETGKHKSDHHDNVMLKLSDLEKQINDLRDSLNQKISALKQPATTTVVPKTASLHVPIGGGFSGVSIAAGADDEGDIAGQVRGLYFRKAGEHFAWQAQGDFSYYDIQQEGQVDAAFIYQKHRFKAAAAASYKWVSIDGFEAGRLGQGALIADWHFNNAKFGVFGTFPFADGDVISRTAVPNLPTHVTELTMEVPTQYGLDFGVSFGTRVDFSGYVAGMDAQTEDINAGLRLDVLVRDHLSWYLDFELNESLVNFNDESSRYLTGLRFGSWNKARYNLGEEITPVHIPNIRYEIVARRTRVGNSPPTALAGQSRMNVPAGAVTLDGSNSRDRDGDPITHRWTQINGPAVTILRTNEAVAEFTGRVGESYIFQLTVTDSGGETASDNVSISMEAAPIPAPRILAFNVSPSTIDRGELSSMHWATQDATEVRITSVGIVGPEGTLLISPESTTEYTMTATNSVGSVSQSVTVTVNEPPPIPDPVIHFFNAIPSEITEGEFATLTWSTQYGETVSISGFGRVEPSGSLILSPKQTTTYTLTVTSGSISVDESVTVTVIPLNPEPPNETPIANAGADQIVNRPTMITLNGAASFDPNGDPLTYEWTQVLGLPVTLNGADTTMASFQAVSGKYAFKLLVSDDKGASSTDEVTITVISVKR